MKMSIARALKERKRIIGEMNTIRTRLNANNGVQVNIKVDESGKYNAPTAEDINKHRKLDPKALMKQWYELREKLIDLKVKLQTANNGIAKQLVELSELKNELSIVDSQCYGTSNAEFYSDKLVRVYDFVYDEAWHLAKVDELRKQINDLQDEIDEYNATHFIEVA